MHIWQSEILLYNFLFAEMSFKICVCTCMRMHMCVVWAVVSVLKFFFFMIEYQAKKNSVSKEQLYH